MGFDIFDIMGTLFPIVFLAFGIIFGIKMIRGINQWPHKNDKPRIPEEVLAESKHENIRHGHHDTDTADAPNTSTTTLENDDK